MEIWNLENVLPVVNPSKGGQGQPSKGGQKAKAVGKQPQQSPSKGGQPGQPQPQSKQPQPQSKQPIVISPGSGMKKQLRKLTPEEFESMKKQASGMDQHIYKDGGLEGKEEGSGAPSTGKTADDWVGPIITARQEDEKREKDPGSGNGCIDRVVEDVLTPKVDWKNALRTFVSDVSRQTKAEWLRPNKRWLGSKIYQPSRKIIQGMELLIAVDASGSTLPDYNRFISEIIGVFKAFQGKRDVKAEVIFWTDVVFPETVKLTPGNYQELINYKLDWTGGTRISCVNEWIIQNKRKPKGVIYFTDGAVESNPTIYPYTRNLFILPFSGYDEHLKGKGPIVFIDDGHGGKR